MDWEPSGGSLTNIDDIQADDTSPLTAYLWGFLVTLAVILALREWARHRSRGHGRGGREHLWNFIVMAILWPLFVTSIIFVVLWAVLTRHVKR